MCLAIGKRVRISVVPSWGEVVVVVVWCCKLKFEHTRVVWVVGLVAKTTEGSLRVASPTISRTRPQQVPQHPSLELYGRRQSSIDYSTTNAKYPLFYNLNNPTKCKHYAIRLFAVARF